MSVQIIRGDAAQIPLSDDSVASPQNTQTDPLPCGHRTKHGQRIGCCAGCQHLFSSDTAFNAHRRVGQCLDPRDVGLVGRPSRTAPGEVIWAFPASDVPWGER